MTVVGDRGPVDTHNRQFDFCDRYCLYTGKHPFMYNFHSWTWEICHFRNPAVHTYKRA